MSDTDKEERIRTRVAEIRRRQTAPIAHDSLWEQARREIEVEDEDAAGLQSMLAEAIGLAAGLNFPHPGGESPTPDPDRARTGQPARRRRAGAG